MKPSSLRPGRRGRTTTSVPASWDPGPVGSVGSPCRPFVLPDRRLLDLVVPTLLRVVLVLLGGVELGVEPGSLDLALPAKLDAVVAIKDRERVAPALSPFLRVSKIFTP